MSIRERFSKIVVEHLGVDPGRISDNADFVEQLGADSLDGIELLMAVEEEFDIRIEDDEAEKISTFGEAMALIEKRAGERT